jgi:serine/threonine protein kinase
VIVLDAADDALDGLRGARVGSEIPGGFYQFDRRLGAGGMGSAFLVERTLPSGQGPAVIKVVHPAFVSDQGELALRTVLKEVTALRRLAQRTPPSPHVVRYLEAGSLRAQVGARVLDLPWIAIEYVQGGSEGTTLTERVDRVVRATGSAFDAERAARAVEGMARGLGAVHAEGVIHRDLKPDNILCCGRGDEELLKITDFGVARPAGLAATFGNCFVGTPGFASPEQSSIDERLLGPWSDVFALAAITYYLLTGQEYFTPPTPADAIMLARAPARRPLLASPFVHASLASRPALCAALDLALARGSAYRGHDRPPSAALFASSVVSLLRAEPWRSPSSVSPLVPPPAAFAATAPGTPPPPKAPVWGWSWVSGPTRETVRCVAWNSDGRGLAVTARGLSFWDGAGWKELPDPGLPSPRELRFVRRVAQGRWIVGGDQSALAIYAAEGTVEAVSGGDRRTSFVQASGVLGDLVVVAGQSLDGPVTLLTLVGRRWLRALPVDALTSVASVARLDDERWVVTGRGQEGAGYVGIHSPLQWTIERTLAPRVRSFGPSAGREDQGIVLVGGAQGALVWIEPGAVRPEVLGSAADVSAVALDQNGIGWATTPGTLWRRQGDWSLAWRDPATTSPFVALFADRAQVVAVTAEGAVLEGRPR